MATEDDDSDLKGEDAADRRELEAKKLSRRARALLTRVSVEAIKEDEPGAKELLDARPRLVTLRNGQLLITRRGWKVAAHA